MSQDQQPTSSTGPQHLSQDAAFFLSNYRMGKTLGVGSFGKVSVQRISSFTNCLMSTDDTFHTANPI